MICVIGEKGLVLLLFFVASVGEIIVKMSSGFVRFHLVMIGCEFDVEFFFLLLELFDSGVDFCYLVIEFFMVVGVLLLGLD
jgi:hypothetical protein